MKYVIHACNKRMWYVEKYLIPSLKSQGIKDEDIIVKCDKYEFGNLFHCMNIFSSMRQEGGAWHIQDDVLLCRDFKERTDVNTSDIICGFVSQIDENVDKVGYVKPIDMWWSFPCIYIPNNIARECSQWFNLRGKDDEKYLTWSIGGQHDDFFFMEYMQNYYPDYPVYQMQPCLVEHVDFLIGGTTLKQVRRDRIVRAKWFDDLDLVDELAEKLSGENTDE